MYTVFTYKLKHDDNTRNITKYKIKNETTINNNNNNNNSNITTTTTIAIASTHFTITTTITTKTTTKLAISITTTNAFIDFPKVKFHPSEMVPKCSISLGIINICLPRLDVQDVSRTDVHVSPVAPVARVVVIQHVQVLFTQQYPGKY